jgi:predicted acyl esterase
LSQLYPNNLSGIKALTELAEQGDTGAMQSLSDYFKQKGEGCINEWTHKCKLQAEADRVVEKERERERERIEKEREKREREREKRERERIEKEREKREREEKKQYIKEQLPIKKAQLKKYGCIMPKGL